MKGKRKRREWKMEGGREGGREGGGEGGKTYEGRDNECDKERTS